MNNYSPYSETAYASEYSIVGKGSDYISTVSADIVLPELTCLLYVGVGGDLILEGRDGSPIFLPKILDGSFIPINTKKIIYQASVMDLATGVPTLQTTSAADIVCIRGL